MAGPLIGMLGKADRRDVRPARSAPASARWPARCSPPPTSACRSAPAGKAALRPRQRHGVRRGPRRPRRRRAALPRAARGRPPAAVRRRAVAARPPDRRGRRTTAAASTIDTAGIQQTSRSHARHRPDQPRGDAGGPRGRAVRARADSPPQKAALERLETTLALVEGWVDEVVGQATAERMPDRRQAAGGRPPPPRRGRTGRADLRHPGRPRAAAPPAARRLARCGARCAPARAPRPATASGCTPTCCPPPPTSTTRWASARTAEAPEALTEEDFDAELRDLLDGGPTRRPADGPTGPPRSERCTPTRSPCCALGARRRRAGRAARRATSRTSTAHPDGLRRSCFPDHLTAGALVLCQDAAPVLLNLHRKARRWFHFGGHLEPATPRWPAPRCARRPRSPASPACVVDPEPLHLDEHAVDFCDPRGAGAPPRRAVPGPRRARAPARGQRGVARRALVAGRRLPDRRGRHGRAGRPGARALASSTSARHRRRLEPARPRTSRRGSPRPLGLRVAVDPAPRTRASWPGSSRWASSWTST